MICHSLLAIGVEQFTGIGNLEKVAEFIQKNMLPTKTVLRITGRVKNLSTTRAAENALQVRLLIK